MSIHTYAESNTYTPSQVQYQLTITYNFNNFGKTAQA